MMAAEKFADTKKKKKRWLTVLASRDFNNQYLAEVYVNEPDEALGRRLSINLMALTKDPKKQLFNVEFKINEIKDNNAITELTDYRIQAAQLKRILKKGRNKVEDSFVYAMKENQKIVIKPILLTKSLVYKTILQEIRRATRKFLFEYTNKNTFPQIMRDIISGKLQKDLRENAKKIYPVINVIIKDAHILH